MENLTHLSWVFDNAINSNASASIFKIALKIGSNLKSLWVRGNLKLSLHSQYFQKCIGTLPEALPQLTEFGIYMTSSHSDPDFFPAVAIPKTEGSTACSSGAWVTRNNNCSRQTWV